MSLNAITALVTFPSFSQYRKTRLGTQPRKHWRQQNRYQESRGGHWLRWSQTSWYSYPRSWFGHKPLPYRWNQMRRHVQNKWPEARRAESTTRRFGPFCWKHCRAWLTFCVGKFCPWRVHPRSFSKRGLFGLWPRSTTSALWFCMKSLFQLGKFCLEPMFHWFCLLQITKLHRYFIPNLSLISLKEYLTSCLLY